MKDKKGHGSEKRTTSAVRVEARQDTRWREGKLAARLEKKLREPVIPVEKPKGFRTEARAGTRWRTSKIAENFERKMRGDKR